MIRTYLTQIESVIDQYTAALFVAHISFSVEPRPGDQTYLYGSILFADGSALHFREFIDASGKKIRKLSYSYHYQDAQDRLVFRYDDAKHRPTLGYIEHKHEGDAIFQARSPELGDVVAEIVDRVGWL